MNGAFFAFFVLLVVRLTLNLYGHEMVLSTWLRLGCMLFTYVAAPLAGYNLEQMLKTVFGKEKS